MKFKGRIFKFGDDVNTDEIISARYLNTIDEKKLAKHCMEDIDPDFSKKVNPGDIIVAGKNFGCGSSREHAPIAIKGCGVICVVASSFARIFYRNAINIGLPIFEVGETKGIDDGDELFIGDEKGEIINLTKNRTYTFIPFPPFIQEIIKSGGLINYTKRKL